MNFQFESLAELLAMKGHGPFVWSAYSISIIAFAYLIWTPVKSYRDMVNRELKKRSREENAPD
ncbi:MAG: heme exporter protein CcmD [Cellvibrio sp.]|nr:heme exporter protein CcmD [Cellvibrio sp.]